MGLCFRPIRRRPPPSDTILMWSWGRNRAAERLSGYSREEILGKHFRDFVSPEYLGQVGETFGKKLEGTGETNYEIEIIRRDGARVPVEVSSRLIHENGVAIGVQE